MSSHELVIDQAGASGPVAEMFRSIISHPDLHMQLGEVATAQIDRIGKRLGDEDPSCPPQWVDKRFIGLKDLAGGGSGSVVFSSLRPEEAGEHEDAIAEDRLLVTNSSPLRMRDDVGLVSAYVNAPHIDELFRRDTSTHILSAGNCEVAQLVVPIMPIHREFRVVKMHIETAQGWSGKGKREVPPGVDDLMEDEDSMPRDERKKIEEEPNKFLGDSIQKHANIEISAHPKRAPWLRGHHAKVILTLDNAASRSEIGELWRYFRAPHELDAVKSELKAISSVEDEKWPGKHWPIKPVKNVNRDLARWDTRPQRLTQVLPMRVKAHLMEVSEADPRQIVIELAGDNLILGAVGGNLLNVVYARAKGYV